VPSGDNGGLEATVVRQHTGGHPAERIDDGVTRALDPRFVSVERIAGMIGTGIASAGIVAGVAVPVLAATLSPSIDRLLLGVGAVIILGLLARAWIWPEVAHRYRSYTVSPASIEIRKGVLWRRVASVPRTRVQHTDVSQGPLERRFGLGTLVIYTAGTEHSKVALSGLSHGTASRIRDHLLPVEEGDAV
jgi:membrane protein YdbS with pleckstrin-like domain